MFMRHPLTRMGGSSRSSRSADQRIKRIKRIKRIMRIMRAGGSVGRRIGGSADRAELAGDVGRAGGRIVGACALELGSKTLVGFAFGLANS